jgi:hypothetical protein
MTSSSLCAATIKETLRRWSQTKLLSVNDLKTAFIIYKNPTYKTQVDKNNKIADQKTILLTNIPDKPQPPQCVIL